jgi:regulator of replication initiation timing
VVLAFLARVLLWVQGLARVVIAFLASIGSWLQVLVESDWTVTWDVAFIVLTVLENEDYFHAWGVLVLSIAGCIFANHLGQVITSIASVMNMRLFVLAGKDNQEIKDNIATLDGKVNDVQTSVSALQQDVSTMQTSVSALQQDVRTIRQTMETRVQNMETRVQNVETSVRNLETSVRQLATTQDIRSMIEQAFRQLAP